MFEACLNINLSYRLSNIEASLTRTGVVLLSYMSAFLGLFILIKTLCGSDCDITIIKLIIYICPEKIIFSQSQQNRLGPHRSRNPSAAPRPLQIISATAAIHVKYFTAKIQAMAELGFHSCNVNLVNSHTSAAHLCGSCVL